LSRTLWDLDWSRHLPFALGEMTIEQSSYERAEPFVAAHYPSIFEEDAGSTPFSSSQRSSSKARYYQALGDFFEFKLAARTIGLVVCTPLDWATYYVRSAGLLPEYQGSQAIQHFFSRLVFDVLREAGVERVELDVAPSNLAMMHVVTRLRFNATGTLLSERWGAHVHFTKFLSQGSEHTFIEQFCSGPKYQLRTARGEGQTPVA
jgi:RimJ/RimL family protein N-acetyltransferase